MSRIVIVPGLAVRAYARPAALAARRSGLDVELLRPPAWHGAPADLAEYGVRLAERLEDRGGEIDVLVGLSVGSQAAAVAATRTRAVRHLLLVSPTVDPANRTVRRLLGRWLNGDPADEAPGWVSQLPDWAHAGIPRIATGLLSALRIPLECVLPRASADLTIVHAEHDSLGTREWAAALATDNGGRLVDKPGRPHSWPVDDAAGFVALLGELAA